MDEKKTEATPTPEFAILELEERLEFSELCDDNCGCNNGGTNTNCSQTPPTVNLFC